MTIDTLMAIYFGLFTVLVIIIHEVRVKQLNRLIRTQEKHILNLTLTLLRKHKSSEDIEFLDMMKILKDLGVDDGGF